MGDYLVITGAVNHNFMVLNKVKISKFSDATIVNIALQTEKPFTTWNIDFLIYNLSISVIYQLSILPYQLKLQYHNNLSWVFLVVPITVYIPSIPMIESNIFKIDFAKRSMLYTLKIVATQSSCTYSYLFLLYTVSLVFWAECRLLCM